jgi:HK97 gp10 family phage protein
MRVTVKITGVKEVQDALNSLPDAVRADALGNVLFEAAKPIADAARANAPVRTGKLRDSIKISLRARGMGEWVRASRGAGIFIGATAPHAHFSEFGTAREPAQGWFRRAYDSAAPKARQVLETGLLDAVMKAVRRARVKT